MKREEADMDHLDLEAPGLTAGNVEKIAALFPAAVTETRGADGKVKKAVNFEVLKQLLAPDVAEGEERYEFTWVGGVEGLHFSSHASPSEPACLL